MTTVILPMAGAGRRFVKAGYTDPKPFIDVAGRPMIERVLENLFFPDSQFVLIAQHEHTLAYAPVFDRLTHQYPVQVMTVQGLTEGAACTVLAAARVINNEAPIIITNSDELLDLNVEEFLQDATTRELDGSLVTFKADGPKWSYAAVNDEGLVIRTAEKQPISEHATAGVYYFSCGRDFIYAAIDMIVRNDRVNNEFYVAPTYNYAIKAGARVGIYEVASSAMHCLGTPEDLKRYVSQVAVPV